LEEKMSEGRVKYYNKDKECSSTEERLKRQFSQFLEDLKFAYNNCEYYKEHFKDVNFDEIKSYEDLIKIPKTNKSEIVNIHKSNPPFGGMIANGANLKRIYVSPGPIYDPEGEAEDYWNLKEIFTNAGFKPGDRVINTFSYHLTPAGIFCDEALKNLGCTMIPTGVGNTEIQIQTLKNLQATGYIGTPSFLNMLIKKAESMGYNWNEDFNLKIACVAGEMLTKKVRRELEDNYNIIVRQFFATADMGGIGYECHYKAGIHFSENRLIEIVNPDTGKHCKPGEPGELVVSTLGNRTYPLIRLGTGDLIVHTEEPCGCGRTSFRIEKILGRVDMVTKVRGMFIHPGQVTELVKKFEHIVKGKMVITRENDYDIMTFYAELKKDIPPTETFKENIINAIRDIFKLKGDVQFVDEGFIKDDDKLVDDQRKWD
jgi:phenylacetate-CoA ligase